jgi:hypothetical protein
LHEVGQALLSAKDDDVSEQQEAWAEAFAALRKLTGS